MTQSGTFFGSSPIQRELEMHHLRLAAEAAKIGAWYVHPETKLLEYDAMLAKLFGYEGKTPMTRDQVMGQIVNEYIDYIDAVLQTAKKGSGEYDFTYQQRRFNDGKLIWLRSIGKVLQTVNETEVIFSGLVMDITSQNEMRFRSMLQEAPVAIFVLTGEDMVFETVNNKMYQMLGKNTNLIGKRYIDVMPELADQPFFRLLEEVYRTGKTCYGNEIKGTVNVDGKPTEGYFNFTYQPIKDDKDQVTGIMCVATDIVDQVKARKTIERAQEVLRIATESGELGTWCYQPNIDKFTTSSIFNSIFGFSEDEQPSYESAILCIKQEDRQRVHDAVYTSFNEGAPFNVEYQINCRNNQIRWIKSVGKIVHDENGNDYVTGIIYDITDLKNEDQRKSDFIAMVSHELKTPITSLNGYLQSMQRRLIKWGDSFKDELTELLLHKANAQLSKMTNLINDFLNLSRLESGKIHINKQPFDLAVLLKETEEECKETISSHQVVFLPTNTIIVTADRDKIGHVINNFISNAVKYSAPNSVVIVSCQLNERELVITVKDEGIGIPRAEISKIFERFYRVNEQSNTISGFGIGLYLCKEIIVRHEGKIWVESELNKGSSFHFSLSC